MTADMPDPVKVAREVIRKKMLEQNITSDRDTYSDGFANGLAFAIQQTRCDWSEGAYRVSAAFHRFTIKDNEDKEIANCIASILADFEDGREFRDCSWSYDRLFSSVADQQLASDTQKAMERCARD